MLAFPDMIPDQGGFAPFSRVLSGGQSLTGFEQVSPQRGDRWVASFRFPLRSNADLIKIRGFIAAMGGRTNTVLLPAYDRKRGPFVPAAVQSPIGTQVSNPAWYRDFGARMAHYRLSPEAGIGGIVTITASGSISANGLHKPVTSGMWVRLLGVDRQLSNLVSVSAGSFRASVFPAFDLAPTARTAPAATLAAGAALGATSVSVSLSVGTAPLPGHLFSIGARLYMAKTVTGGGPFAIGIWPTLRADVAGGVAVDFVNPACEMRFASDGEGLDALRSLEQMRFGSIPLQFTEASF